MRAFRLIYEFYPISFDYTLVVALVFSAAVLLILGAVHLYPRLRRHEYWLLFAAVVASFPLAAGPVGSIFSAIVFRTLTLLVGPEAIVHQLFLIAIWLAVGAVLTYRLVRAWWHTRRWVAGLPLAGDDAVFDQALREVLP
ncbi:MAG: hypothetical protein LIQ31_14965, partial [Planctomycetes bacterium]|nr:hypothetical protein [Planctomycetota bacterium]